MEKCPICFRQFPVKFLERHVNSCLDTLPSDDAIQTQNPEVKTERTDAFAALGLKADSRKAVDRSKKTATLTSLLIAERKLKRRQEELERVLLGSQRAAPTDDSHRVGSAESHSEENHKTSDKDDAEIGTVAEAALEQLPEAKSPDNSANYKARAPPAPASQASASRFAPQPPNIAQLKREAELPLAQRLRPRTLDEFHGQEKLVGPNGVLRNIMGSGKLPSFILWGGPGVGKTSLARIVASTSNYRFVELSGAESSAKSLRATFEAAQNEKNLTGTKTILFLDEIHRFNKAVQDILLPVLEKGVITVIGATTENPSFSLNNALLSRMHTFVMDPLDKNALVRILNRGLLLVNKTRKLVHKLHLVALSRDAIDHIASLSGGDSRIALGILESVSAYLSGLEYHVAEKQEPEKETIDVKSRTGVIKVSLDQLKLLLGARNFHQMYDRVGDNHYDTISAFHKSVRGSDADAAVFYLVKMLTGGEDPLFIARRMIVIASEDVGLRDSSCLPFAISVLEALKFIGMPEGEIVLAHCAVKLARAPKLTKSYRALRNAQALFRENPDISRLPIPLHLRNAPTKLMEELGYGDSYKYNPNFELGKVRQVYLHPDLGDVKFVEPTHLGTAQDTDVKPEDLQREQELDQEYLDFKRDVKKRRKDAQITEKTPLSSPIATEHLLSYDENLSKDVQPEYFEGSRDNYSDDPDCLHNFGCSYDEFDAQTT